jgi:hypothetical protein
MSIAPGDSTWAIDFARRLQNGMNQLGEPASLETEAPQISRMRCTSV